MAHESIELEQSVRVLREVIDNLVGTLTVGQIYDDSEIMDYVIGKQDLLRALMERTKPIDFVDCSDLTKWAEKNGYIHESCIERD